MEDVRQGGETEIAAARPGEPAGRCGVWASPLGGLLAQSQTTERSRAVAGGNPDAEVITKAGDALDVFDFEAAARKILPPAHFGYLATGTDGDDTVRANREAFTRYQLHVRRLVNVATPDMSVKLFGATYDTPIVAGAGQQPAGVPCRWRSRRRQGRASQEASADSLDAVVDAARGGQRRARRAGLVPALPHQRLERDDGSGRARREGGLHGARADGRQPRQQPRHASSG